MITNGADEYHRRHKERRTERSATMLRIVAYASTGWRVPPQICWSSCGQHQIRRGLEEAYALVEARPEDFTERL